MDFDNFLQGLKQRLTDDKFRVAENVVLPDGRVVELVASRRRWYCGLLLSQHFFVIKLDEPIDKDVDDLYKAGLRYAKQKNRVPLLRGMMFGYEIIPCIVTKNAGEKLKLLSYVTRLPSVRFAQLLLPVVFDLASGKAHYFRGAAVWGGLLWPELQYLTAKHIENKPLSKEEELRLQRRQWSYWIFTLACLIYAFCACLPLLIGSTSKVLLLFQLVAQGFIWGSFIPMFIQMRRTLQEEKQTLQARWDAEDIKLFGQPLEPR